MCPVILEKDCEGKALEVASESFNQNMCPVILEKGFEGEAGLCVLKNTFVTRGDFEGRLERVGLCVLLIVALHLSCNTEEAVKEKAVFYKSSNSEEGCEGEAGESGDAVF